MSAARNFGISHHEFPVTPTLTVRIVFTDSEAQNPRIDAAAAVTHIEAVIAQIKAATPKPAKTK